MKRLLILAAFATLIFVAGCACEVGAKLGKQTAGKPTAADDQGVFGAKVFAGVSR